MALPSLMLAALGSSAYASNTDLVNPLIGNTGPEPNYAGGMIPSVAPPFGMTRWVAQTHQNWVSKTPYNWTDSDYIHGFVGTHQPAIWMGESGLVAVVPGASDAAVNAIFEDRGLRKAQEKFGASLYEVELLPENGGSINVEMTATSRVGHLRFTFDAKSQPYILIQASRPSQLFHSTPSSSHFNTTYPDGYVHIYAQQQQICGYSTEMQDTVIAPVSTTALWQEHLREGTGHGGFKGWFCARFDAPFAGHGLTQGKEQREDDIDGFGAELSAYARFALDQKTVNVRIATSFISMEQALYNLEQEAPDGISFEDTEAKTRAEWEEKLNRVELKGGSKDNQTTLVTAVFHALQYPYEISEYGKYYSALDDQVHEGVSYSGYSIWDTYRAEWGFLLLMAPERIPGMIQSMLNDYKEGGWLPMWKNLIETNIMIATHADSLIAEAVLKGFDYGYDLDVAWDAVWKDATVPPVKDWETLYEDREEGVDYEVRAGLSTSYGLPEKGWVNDDVHSESVSRTLGYAYDDYAAAQLAKRLGKPAWIVDMLLKRSMTAPWLVWNADAISQDDYPSDEDKKRFEGKTKGFVQGRNSDGSWAAPTSGFTEGDKWAYSFDIAHDIPGLVEKRGGNEAFVESLDEHYDGGWDWFGNEPSHHIPYLYTLAGRPDLTQRRVREVAGSNFNATPFGLSGNEDCGQMSAWFFFSALGFYPVNPVSLQYVVGTAFFDKMTVRIPVPKHHGAEAKSEKFYEEATHSYVLTVEAEGAQEKLYVKTLWVNGEERPIREVGYDEFGKGGHIRFEMSAEPVLEDSRGAIVHEEL
ncbi:glycoside hydrolase family 92 protein [Cylindrobasidium torrendii FP15055 ss-10]|uniref:Glycoside hydrolase family 92 protein n=1 Tax=Cylindrobasidium torrendii FP15055 ss-10 TaxID=1314674 RepID=A0A0D7BBS4_9AGAR|nr:glycoside hydrolase family 92 protein [Cylindrobasidium torrendii FP15055 ss-10]